MQFLFQHCRYLYHNIKHHIDILWYLQCCSQVILVKVHLDAETFCHRHRQSLFSRDTLLNHSCSHPISGLNGVPNWSMTLRPDSQYRVGKQCARPAGLAPVSKLESKSVFKTLTGPSPIYPSHDAPACKGDIVQKLPTVFICNDRQVHLSPPQPRLSLLQAFTFHLTPDVLNVNQPSFVNSWWFIYRLDKVKELVSKCLQARDMAYCPYSRFPVGAAILTTDGAIITGNNPADDFWLPVV